MMVMMRDDCMLYVETHTHTHTHTCTCTHTHTHAYIYTYMHTHMHAYTLKPPSHTQLCHMTPIYSHLLQCHTIPTLIWLMAYTKLSAAPVTFP